MKEQRERVSEILLEFREKGTPLFMGVPCDQLTQDELIGALNHAGEQLADAQDSHLHSLRVLGELRSG